MNSEKNNTLLYNYNNKFTIKQFSVSTSKKFSHQQMWALTILLPRLLSSSQRERKKESLFVRVLQTWGLRVHSWKPCFARTGSSKFVTLSSLLLRSLFLSLFWLLFLFCCLSLKCNSVMNLDYFWFTLCFFIFGLFGAQFFFFFFENNLNCLYLYLICFSI